MKADGAYSFADHPQLVRGVMPKLMEKGQIRPCLIRGPPNTMHADPIIVFSDSSQKSNDVTTFRLLDTIVSQGAIFSTA